MYSRRMLLFMALIALTVGLSHTSLAQPDPASGQVTVPLTAYTELLEQGRQTPRPAQAEYAIGEAQIDVSLDSSDDSSSATVTINAVIETYRDEWSLVPLLPTGVALSEVLIDGQPTALVQTDSGLAWSTQHSGPVSLTLRYRVDAQRSGTNWLLAIPLPQAASAGLTVRYPGLGVDLVALPATAARQETDPDTATTTLYATLPASAGVTISWREPLSHRHALSRANYQGEFRGDALAWQASYEVMLFTDEAVTLPLFPQSITLSDLRVDDESATVLLEEGHFAVTLQGQGKHQIAVDFQTPILDRNGPPGVNFPIPAIPVSQFSLSLPGSKEISVSPQTNVESRTTEDSTIATVFLPLSEAVEFSWVEAIPDRMQGQVRANASLYHLIHAEPGVLLGQAIAAYEISHGETHQLRLQIPTAAQVNRVRGPGVSDWIVEPNSDGPYKPITVFLDRAVRGNYTLEIDYEYLLGSSEAPVAVPLLSVLDVNRQRGVVALLAGPELGLEPVESSTLVDVSEHQLPATVRSALTMKVARTYKYTDPTSQLLVTTIAPERRQARINVGLYQVLRAEPGVLLGRTFALYEITQGDTDLLTLDIAADAQINRILSPHATLADWSVTQADEQGRKQIKVFLEQAVQGELLLEVEYERLLNSDAEDFPTPLLQARNVNRQRGMIALLSGSERAIRPISSEGVSGVGEDQLPALVRNRLAHSVAHSYRYIGELPLLTIRVEVPERQQGLFDAQVATLISLGEVSLRAAASVDVNVKSGALMALDLQLPDDLNVLSVVGPSLRSQQVETTADGQRIAVEFTQEMIGQFRLEVIYERIFASSDNDTVIPTLKVTGAEIEHGRIAIEALSAVEVQPATITGVSRIDSNELPRQLVLKTTNPILLAYKYVRAEQPFNLALNITRHQDIDLQAATIETADYSTLYTRDGLAVTTANFQVRNSRRQFLRLSLPSASEVWSVLVNGQAEKPAQADDGTAILIKLLNVSNGFPIEVVYATPTTPLTRFGSLSGQLPRPDIIVTRSTWQVLLPTDFHYWQPQSNLDLISQGRRIQADRTPQQATTAAAPLLIQVPNEGIEFRFTKLYANQSPAAAGFTVRYLHSSGNYTATATMLLGALLLGISLLALWRTSHRKVRQRWLLVALVAVLILVTGLGLGG